MPVMEKDLVHACGRTFTDPADYSKHGLKCDGTEPARSGRIGPAQDIPSVPPRRVMELVEDFAEQAFTNAGDGDLQAAARAAAIRAVSSGLVSGPLWDEAGAMIVAHFVRIHRFHLLRQRSQVQSTSGDQSRHDPESSAMDVLYEVDGRWLPFGDLKRSAVLVLAEDRLKRSETLRIEARYHERIAKGMKLTETVRERYSDADLARIRKEVERDEK